MYDSRLPKQMQANNALKARRTSVNALLLALTMVSLTASQSHAQQRLTSAQQTQLNMQMKEEEEAKDIAERKRWMLSKEGLAYTTTFTGGANHPEFKSQYMQQLSDGGKIYFLTCRQDFAEALKFLDKSPKRETGSALYLRAKCLDGQHKRLDAINIYEKASKKIGKGFAPGFRFYLHFAAAQAAVGKDVEALKNLKAVTEKSADAARFSSTKAAVAQAVLKRVGYLQEKHGKYKEAFENYLSLFEDADSQFRLEEPIQVDASVKLRAGKWLKEHLTPPAGADTTNLSKYLITAAKAHLAQGDEKQAKALLERAVALREKQSEIPNKLVEGFSTPLAQARIVASSILCRLDIRDKDYKSACKHIRAAFDTDPAQDDKKMLQCISMADVSDLVTKKDRDLHSSTAEQLLDKGPIRIRYSNQK